ncbi:hypothetical protein PJM35_0088 [Salmonella phage vB_SenS_UTK0007]|uniref:Uncharacterized protein n=2 Tax=Tlsvirus TaxID=1920865 RepID=A0AAE9ZNE4_9CAUD|nr:hypothetical protein [Escherichia phage vB_EcoS_011D2]WDR21666.1 hypothetical protein PJM35_0088 [Salmonella phage vB_SenS_UTK0007]
MNSTLNFRSYTQTVDFEGVNIPLPNIYRYITRDKFGFICAWREKPKKVGDEFGDGSEMPITLGHQQGENLTVVIRKYRRSRTNSIISIFGIVGE